MYDYFANKSKHRLIVKNMHKNMAIYLKNRNLYEKKKKLENLEGQNRNTSFFFFFH